MAENVIVQETNPTILSGQPEGTPPVSLPSQPAPAAGTILTTPVSPVKTDGTFIENWRDTLPEEIRKEECLNLVKDFPEMARQFVNQRKAIGKDKITVPNEKSRPDEWTEFYSAIGRPKTEGDYQVQVPEDLKEIFDSNRIEAARKTAFSLGATQKQFEAYMKNEIEQVSQLLANEDKLEDEARGNAEKNLRKEFGAAYDERVHISNRLIAEAFPKEEERMKFLEEFGNSPTFIRFASRIGARMSEHTALIGELTQKTPNEAQAKIKELQATSGYNELSGKITQEERQRITDEIRDLYKQVYPAKTG